MKIFSTDLTKEQATGTGMAMVLILLILGFYLKNNLFFRLAVPVLLINMILPMVFYPLAIVWFGLSNVMGSIMSKVILGILFLTLVTPIGLIRKLIGKDSLQLKQWKKGNGSVLKTKNHTFTAYDLEKPY